MIGSHNQHFTAIFGVLYLSTMNTKPQVAIGEWTCVLDNKHLIACNTAYT